MCYEKTNIKEETVALEPPSGNQPCVRQPFRDCARHLGSDRSQSGRGLEQHAGDPLIPNDNPPHLEGCEQYAGYSPTSKSRG